MRSKKSIIFIVPLLFLTLLLCQVSWTAESTGFGSAAKTYDKFDYESFSKTLLKKGYVRVMVKLDVPEIALLTALSTTYRTGYSNQAYIQAAYDADLALERAISLTRDSLLYQLNGSFYKVNRTFKTLPYVALTVSADTLDQLEKIPEAVSVVEDKAIRLPPSLPAQTQNVPDDISRPLLSQSISVVGADVAWGLGYSGEGWYVAILDTGILSSHEMFQGKNIVEQCYALGDDWYDRENGGCPNGGIEMSGPGSAAPYDSRFGHGTHVAGIAAGNNYIDRFGVARDANIIAVQVFSYFPYENDVLSWSSDQVKGLEFVYTMRNTYNIAAVNMSLGGERYYSYCEGDSRKSAIDNLRAAGIATAVASGNEGYCDSISSPACVSSAIAVNATTKQDGEYFFGNWNDLMVDLMAPGESIISANSTGNANYSSRSGTSMAAPHVAGAWAIMKQYDPTMSVDEVLTLLQDTGQQISSSRCSGAASKPRFNVGYAISTLLTLSPPINVSAQQVANRSLLRTEYINEITWESNPLNASRNVSHYKVYLVQGSQMSLLAQVNNSTFSYMHRGVEQKQDMIYAVSAVDDQGQESLPRQYTLNF
jgi:subtilisin family serine protease